MYSAYPRSNKITGVHHCSPRRLQVNSYQLCNRLLCSYTVESKLVLFSGVQLLNRMTQFIKSSDPTHRPVYNEAFNVVCVGLRSHFDVHSRDTATLSDVLKTIVNITTRPMIIQEDLWLYSFGYLARKDSEPIDFLCRLFPEMDCVEVCSRIVENYLSFEIWCVYPV